MFKSVICRYVPQGPMLTQLPNGTTEMDVIAKTSAIIGAAM